LAWSEADDVPDVVAPTDPYDYGGAAATDAMGGPRPPMQFEPATGPYDSGTAKRTMPFGLLVAGLLLVLLAIALAVWFVLRSNESTPSPSSTTVSTTAPASPTSEAPPPPASEAPAAPQEEPPATQTITQQPETITQTQEPPPPTSEAPPPPPPSSEAPPPAPESPSSASSPPRLIPSLPYPTIPGLPFVPAPVPPGP
jgi:cytoskeletal protein RodZ